MNLEFQLCINKYFALSLLCNALHKREVCANKLNGERGILFTCAYVSKFNEMEQERAEPEALAPERRGPEPRLGEVNACARLIVSGMKALGATPQQVMKFLKETYGPLGFDMEPVISNKTAPRWHNAGGIAGECGMFSLGGKPHAQAAARILKDVLLIGEEHRRAETDYYGIQTGMSILYDDCALLSLLEWLRDNDWPENIEIGGTIYRVQYQF